MLVTVRQSVSPFFALADFTNTSKGMLTLLRRIKDSRIILRGDLEFVNDWKYFSLGTFTIDQFPIAYS